MNDTIKAILREIIDDYMIDCKSIRSSNLEIAGTKMQYGTSHLIMYYKIKSIGKTIYFEFDEYRNLAREVQVFE